MNEIVPVLKDEIGQKPIPSVWRTVFVDIVEALMQEDYLFARDIIQVRPLSPERAIRIEHNIKNYGARLTSLPEDSWRTSVCQWMGGFWDVLIDLFTVEEGASDLVLAARVYEEGATHIFEIHSVYVP